MQGLEFLDRARRNSVEVSGEDVIVVGGGNTAVDAARSAHRLGAASVRIVYRRTRQEMPAIPEEVDDAIDEGIAIDFLCSPRCESRATGGKRLLTCERMELGEPDDSGRRRPVVRPGFGIRPALRPRHTGPGPGGGPVAVAGGNHAVRGTQPVVSDRGAPVYPAGDLLTNEGTVTAAIGCGRDMALRLHERFSGEKLYRDPPAEDSVVRADRLRLQHFEALRPHREQVLPLADREGSFSEVRQGLSRTSRKRNAASVAASATAATAA